MTAVRASRTPVREARSLDQSNAVGLAFRAGLLPFSWYGMSALPALAGRYDDPQVEELVTSRLHVRARFGQIQ